jgi:site-specific DNA-methyltransferase (adenine-specific)
MKTITLKSGKEISLNQAFNMDCLEFMKELPDKCIDLVLTDPPYLVDYKTGHRKDKEHKFCSVIENDNNPEIIEKIIPEYHRIMKDNTALYMFCSFDKVEFFKSELQKYFTIKNMIIWHKNNTTAGDLEGAFGKEYEILFLCNKGRRKIKGFRHSDVWSFRRIVGNKQIHQNQKPLDLLYRAIEAHSDKGEIILDTFLGSFSTALAAKNTERNWIGTELSKEEFKSGYHRYEQETKQLLMEF